MDGVILLESDLPLASTAPKAKPLINESLIESRTDQQSHSNDAACRNDIDPSTAQKITSHLKATRHFPLTPEYSHRHSSIDSRRSISPAQGARSGSVESIKSTPTSNPSFCSHCGLASIRSALHPNENTCHTPSVVQEHELTSHLGPESLGQSSKFLVEDGRSFD